MKKLLLLLLILHLFAACSSDDDNTPKQDYTSLSVYHSEKILLKNVVVGYYTTDSICKKIADLGDLEKDQRSKEISVPNDVKSVYIFGDYPNIATRYDHEFILKKDQKNELFLNSDYTGTKVSKDSKQYPH